MTWKHVAAIGLGAAVGVAGALTGGVLLLPLATLIVGGALGHAQADLHPTKWDGHERRGRERRPTVPNKISPRDVPKE